MALINVDDNDVFDAAILLAENGFNCSVVNEPCKQAKTIVDFENLTLNELDLVNHYEN